MDAIKKKMQAMKMEKENALDRSEQLEQKLRDVEETKSKVCVLFLFFNASFAVYYVFGTNRIFVKSVFKQPCVAT